MNRKPLLILLIIIAIVVIFVVGRGLYRHGYLNKIFPQSSNPLSTGSVGQTTTATGSSLIQSMTILVPEHGGRVDWSNQNIIAFSKFTNKKNGGEIYTMNPDGTNQVCITCNSSQISHISNDQPAWTPDGKYILFQSVDQNLYNGLSLPSGRKAQVVQGGAGLDNNLWLVTPDSKSFIQLTHVGQADAVLHPHFSPDGKKLFWASRATNKTSSGQLTKGGQWMLSYADFIDDSSGPHLSTIKTSQPLGSLAFYETHNFSPDGQTALFSSDINADSSAPSDASAFAGNIYLFNFATGKATPLTTGVNVWNEHAQFSPSGKKIAWITSQGYAFTPTGNWQSTLKTDLWMMNADGSNKQQLTFFNTPGKEQYTGDRVILSDGSWNQAGDKYVMQKDTIGGISDTSQVVVFNFSTPQ